MLSAGLLLAVLATGELGFSVLSEGTCPPQECVVTGIDDVATCESSLVGFDGCRITITALDEHVAESACAASAVIQAHKLPGFLLDEMNFHYGGSGTGCDFDHYEVHGGNSAEDDHICDRDGVVTLLYATGDPSRSSRADDQTVQTSVILDGTMETMDGYQIMFWRAGEYVCTGRDLQAFSVTSHIVMGGDPVDPPVDPPATTSSTTKSTSATTKKPGEDDNGDTDFSTRNANVCITIAVASLFIAAV